ncbi:MAG: sigma 54-interacting transcriptional regulator [Peptococcaceae bacterium]|jgi:transcriptional regulator with PAS, ATPase and Fis domain|nr:sigma 54-interacting transcriptional regulator [Peptococcaceae bacterium]
MLVNKQDALSVNHMHLIKKNEYDILKQYKKDFIENGISPLGRPNIRDDIAIAWIYCRSLGLYPSDAISCSTMTPHKPSHTELLNVAKPLISAFSELAAMLAAAEHGKILNYSLYLFDEENLLLFYDGNSQLTSLPCTDNEVVTGLGAEKFFGGTANNLTLYFQKPIQIVGPEHYLDCLNQYIGAAAPLSYGNGKLAGILMILLETPDHSWGQETHPLQRNTFTWVSTLADVLSQRLKSRKDHVLLKTSWDFMDEGMLIIDKEGRILHLNNQAALILEKSADELCASNLASYMRTDSLFIRMVLAGENFNYLEDILLTPSGKKSYLFSTRTTYDHNEIIGALIRISNINKLKRFVANQNSSIIRFSFDDIIGESDVMKTTKNVAKLFANSNENILLIGESGTGKEMFAQSIHGESRPNKPFIALNCAALPRNLIESELFGYEGGSFTGAERSGRVGKIELADNGTLFLDEIGDMPPEIQAVFLRVLEDKAVMRIGGRAYKPVNFRLIAATNRDLTALIADRQFRADLYYRLSSLIINIPPLCKRKTDILLLVEYLINEYCKKTNKAVPRMATEARETLLSYTWPGNIRELEKAIAHAVITSQNEVISPENLPEYIRNACLPPRTRSGEGAALPPPPGFMTLEEMEDLQIQRALEQCGRNVIKAAALLGISKSALYAKLKKK